MECNKAIGCRTLQKLLGNYKRLNKQTCKEPQELICHPSQNRKEAGGAMRKTGAFMEGRSQFAMQGGKLCLACSK